MTRPTLERELALIFVKIGASKRLLHLFDEIFAWIKWLLSRDIYREFCRFECVPVELEKFDEQFPTGELVDVRVFVYVSVELD